MLFRAVLPLAAIAALAASQPAGRSIGWNPNVEPVATPAGPASSLPQMTVSARGPLLSWVERSGGAAILKFSEWREGKWAEPRTAASGDNWFVNWADVPSVLRLSDGTLAAHWLQKSGAGSYSYDVRLSHSSDEGRTWAPSFTPHHDRTPTEHGFVSLMELRGGGLGLIWLDGRAMQGHGLPGGKDTPEGAMSLRFARYDRDWKQLEDTPIDARVCDCCPTAVAVTADGPIVAFRDRTPTEVRDIHVARLTGGKWIDAGPVHDDRWVINACPVNGPMLSARERTVAAAWFTTLADHGHAFVAFSSDAGQRFGAPVQLDDTSTLGRVDVELMPDGAAVASWIEIDGPRAHFKARRVEPSGARSAAVTISELAASRTSGYPRFAAAGADLVFAWTEISDGRSHVRTAVARAQ